MAKALVFEGCPACEARGGGHSYGASLADITPYATNAIKGGAIGAGSVILLDMALPKILPEMNPMLRTAITGGVLLLGAYYMKDKYPDVATGAALGGGGIIMYKLISQALGKVVSTASAPAALSGIGMDEDDDDGSGMSGMIEISDKPYGVLVPEYGAEEIIIE